MLLSHHIYLSFFAKIITLVVYSSQGASLAELCSCGRSNGEPWRHGETCSGQACRDVASSEELVRLQVSDGRPLGRIRVEHPLDECRRSWVDMLQNQEFGL